MATISQDAAHGMTIFHGSTFDTIYVRFYTEGMRYGVFTAYDKAGNKIEINIAANLDRTPPPVPNNLIAYVYNKVRTEIEKMVAEKVGAKEAALLEQFDFVIDAATYALAGFMNSFDVVVEKIHKFNAVTVIFHIRACPHVFLSGIISP